MKVNAYENKEALSIINKVNFARKTDQNTWKSYFNSEINSGNIDDIDAIVKKELIELYESQKAWVFLVNICVDLIYISMLHNFNLIYNKKRFSTINKRIEKITNCLSIIKELDRTVIRTFNLKCTDIINTSNAILNKVQNNQQIDNSDLNPVLQTTKDILKKSNTLLDTTKCLVGEHGKINPFAIYTHFACVSFKYVDDYDLSEKINSIKKCLKGTTDTDSVILLPEDYSPEIYSDAKIKQLWIIAKQNNGYQNLTRVCLNILYSLKQNVKVVLFHDVGYPNAIKRSEKILSEYICGPFYEYIQTFNSSYFLKVNYTPELIYCIAKDRYSKADFKDFMNSINADEFYCLASDEIVTNSDGIEFANLNYQLKENNEKDGKIQMNKKQIGIITVLDEETQAVVEQLSLTKQKTKLGQRVFYEGQLNGDEVIHNVVLTQQLSQGQESVILAYNDLMNRFSPEMIF